MKNLYLTDNFDLLTHPVEVDQVKDCIWISDAAMGTYGSLTTRPIWSDNDPLLESATLDGPGPFLVSGWDRPEGGCINFVPTSPTPLPGQTIVCWHAIEKKLYKEGN